VQVTSGGAVPFDDIEEARRALQAAGYAAPEVEAAKL